MSARVRVTPEAEADIEEAEAYVSYQQASPGLGGQFLDAVGGTLAQVTEHPQAFGIVHRAIRRALLRKFPYGIFYVIAEKTSS